MLARSSQHLARALGLSFSADFAAGISPDTSHTMILQSSPPDASDLPSRANAREVILPRWPVKRPTSLPVQVSHSTTDSVLAVDAKRRPSGEKASGTKFA